MMKKTIGIVTLIVMLITLMIVLPNMSIPSYAELETFRILVNKEQYIPFGANLTTGSLQSGTWSSSNPSVAAITSQSSSGCNIRGVSIGTATISCKYRYYIAGTYINSYYHCYVEVAESGGNSSGGGSHYVTMTCDHSELTLDLAEPETKYWLWFNTKGSGSSKIHLSIDVRNGWPQNVSFDYDLLSENGSPVSTYCTYPSGQREHMRAPWILHPKKLGGEIITFQLVHESNGRYFNTGFQTVDIPVTVICSHKYNGSVLVQPATNRQKEIREYTCSICGEKTVIEYTEPRVLLNSDNFPDANFLSYIKDNFDKHGYGCLTISDIANISSISCNCRKISSLKGVEYFTALTKLNCSENQLTSLDVSSCTKLTTLDCSVNQLTDLDVSGCAALTTLDCVNNGLTSLNVSNCAKLTTLKCGYNQLTALNIRNCAALTTLNCYRNQFAVLDVSHNTALQTLSVYNNSLSKLDISNNPKLSTLNCTDNNLALLNLGACPKLLSLVKRGSPTTSNGHIQYGTNTGNQLICDQGINFLTIMAKPDLILPASLTEIGEEAFRDNAFICVKLSKGITSIGRNAFADCQNLACVFIPETITSIDAQAFGDKDYLVIYGKSGSYAYYYAQNHGFSFVAAS